MRKARWYHECFAVIRFKSNGLPLAECCGTRADIDNHIIDYTPQTPHKFWFGKISMLIMEATQRECCVIDRFCRV